MGDGLLSGLGSFGLDGLEGMSLDDLLGTSNDGEADEIGSLLDKDERNELIDEDSFAKLDAKYYG